VGALSLASEPKEVVAVSPIEIRAFERRDREQPAALVNAYVDVVVPGRSVSANAVMSRLEREPGGRVEVVGTAFVALRGDEPVGLFELRSDVTAGGVLARPAGWGVRGWARTS
jgi:hypothetical protein